MYVCVLLQSSMFLTRNLKKLYEFTVIPRFILQLVPKKGDEDRENKKFNDLNRNNVNRGDLNRRITVFQET